MEKAKTPIPSGVNVKQAAPIPAMESPMATPPPAPATSIPPPPPASAQMNSMMGDGSFADGGTTPTKSNGIGDFFSGWNWLEIGLMTLGVAGIFYTINYYRYRIKSDKTENSDIQKQLDEVKMNVQSAMKGKYQQI
jgi:hypothetical protein